MKQSLYLFVFLIVLVAVINAQTNHTQVRDTLRKQPRWFIATYPSSILLGDLSVGAEFNHKRLRQELALFYKCYTSFPKYLYDQGFGMNYYLKYNFINRKELLMSVDLGYVYRRVFYYNKIATLTQDSLHWSPNCRYTTDKYFCKSGLSLGMSTLVHLGNNFYFGMNACLDLVHVDSHFTIKEYVSGNKLTMPGNPATEIDLPHREAKQGKGISATFLVKIAYAF